MGGRGRSWEVMGGHGRSWEVMGGHGRSWEVMEGHGRSWEVTGGHGRSWKATEGHGRPRKATDGQERCTHRSEPLPSATPTCDARARAARRSAQAHRPRDATESRPPVQERRDSHPTVQRHQERRVEHTPAGAIKCNQVQSSANSRAHTCWSSLRLAAAECSSALLSVSSSRLRESAIERERA